MDKNSEMLTKTFCNTEYDVLKQVVLCQPQYMAIRDVINETQRKYEVEGIHIETALRQHNEFVQALRDNGVEVILLPYHKKYPEQVFTRDIGVTIGQTVFVAHMAAELRKGEDNVLKQWLDDEEISYFNLMEDLIEGGDVFVDRDKVFVGISDRTNKKAADHLQSILTDHKVIALEFQKKYLHLDCVFNIISPDTALIYSPAFTSEKVEMLRSHYELIEVNEEEQFTLGTNVLGIGNKKIFSVPVNKKVNEELRNRGYEVLEVDITEIIKSGGSFRCCTLPLLREHT
ncbi:dimethylarginine dimethylaminohydrolase family protein [Bacillus pinisoli]|uniref:dimethylarginine dimethylaminohydrolase family protein n=1 Tax=Bacillus pinisoli TaxID=2901866 RepID=UPI001FF29B3D|nr:dimethylarginine dimethylaminohydrolase family protein [Bacillus pinisoli]